MLRNSGKIYADHTKHICQITPGHCCTHSSCYCNFYICITTVTSVLHTRHDNVPGHGRLHAISLMCHKLMVITQSTQSNGVNMGAGVIPVISPMPNYCCANGKLLQQGRSKNWILTIIELWTGHISSYHTQWFNTVQYDT